jgi:DUF1016 N-terminal domain
MTTLTRSTTDLFTRIATILDTARERVVRSVNQETVTAYWHIGREIVEAIQGGKRERAMGSGSWLI